MAHAAARQNSARHSEGRPGAPWSVWTCSWSSQRWRTSSARGTRTSHYPRTCTQPLPAALLKGERAPWGEGRGILRLTRDGEPFLQLASSSMGPQELRGHGRAWGHNPFHQHQPPWAQVLPLGRMEGGIPTSDPSQEVPLPPGLQLSPGPSSIILPTHLLQQGWAAWKCRRERGLSLGPGWRVQQCDGAWGCCWMGSFFYYQMHRVVLSPAVWRP